MVKENNKISVTDYTPIAEFYINDNVNIKIIWRDGQREPFITTVSVVENYGDESNESPVYGPYMIIYDPCGRVNVGSDVPLEVRSKGLFIVDTIFGTVGFAPFGSDSKDITESVQQTIWEMVEANGGVAIMDKKESKSVIH